VVERTPGFIRLIVSGERCQPLFANESGGHRWQRVPPNERNGRVHTSTITVAVLPLLEQRQIHINPSDLEIFACIGSGNGGQNKQKTSSAITVVHKPTGIRIHCENERSQLSNKETAIAVLAARLLAASEQRANNSENSVRKGQIGSGMRGDKRRTVAVQRGTVDDHITGLRWRFQDYLGGRF
jgi:peptide chain release factor 1